MQLKFYEGKEPLEVTAETVFAAVKSIIDSGKEDEFLGLCRERDVGVTVPADVINFVKEYIYEQQANIGGAEEMQLMARRVVESPRCTKG